MRGVSFFCFPLPLSSQRKELVVCLSLVMHTARIVGFSLGELFDLKVYGGSCVLVVGIFSF